MVDVALIKNDVVVNVAVFDDEVWDFETWARFEDENDELMVVVNGEPQIGWLRLTPTALFERPPDPEPEPSDDG